MPGWAPCGYYCQLFPIQPKAQAFSKVLSPEGTVSTSGTGYSIGVTPTCKTETIALMKPGFPPWWWDSSLSQAPALRGKQDRHLLP